MNRKILLSLLVLLPLLASAQSYSYRDAILQYRAGYKMSLLKGIHPLKPEDTSYLRFYEPDSNYRVRATFEQVTGTVPFVMKTIHEGLGPEVREYGIVYFKMNGAAITLRVYRIVTKPRFRILARNIENPDEDIVLFIPFSDRTNYKETFQGGRYLDVSAANLNSGNVVIDFNKACNPHTAYEKRYPYVVTPTVVAPLRPGVLAETRQHASEPDEVQTVQINDIPIEIKAGEKKFGHKPGY